MAYEFAGGPIPAGRHVLHACDNPPCVNATHLFLGDQVSNNADKGTKGRTPHGEAHYNARLTATDVLAIRALSEAHVGQRVIATQYGITQQGVSRIVRRKVWKHV